PGRRGGTPHADRIRPARPSRPPTPNGAASGAIARRGLGLGRRIGDAHCGRSYQGAAAKARRGSDPHSARRRLLPGGTLMFGGLTTKVLGPITAILPRPLDPVRSIKMKLGLLVVTSGFAGLVYFWINIGWFTPGTSTVAIGLSLLTTQILAHGTTRP